MVWSDIREYLNDLRDQLKATANYLGKFYVCIYDVFTFYFNYGWLLSSDWLPEWARQNRALNFITLTTPKSLKHAFSPPFPHPDYVVTRCYGIQYRPYCEPGNTDWRGGGR